MKRLHSSPLFNAHFTRAVSLLGAVLLCLMSACTEGIKAVDFGVSVDDRDEGVGGDQTPDSGEDESNGQCIQDDECARGSYCAFEDDSSLGVCVEGCRVEPDSCERPNSRQKCDPVSRSCFLSCDLDTHCYDEDYCLEGSCVRGCRLDDPSSCPADEAGPRFCRAETRECSLGGVCCDLDDLCSVTDEVSCTEVGGDLLLGLRSCAPNPCRTLCSRDTLCPGGEYCTDFGRCAPGCRLEEPRGCPPDLTCDEETRRCAQQACELDDGCPLWQYCGAQGRCLEGCRAGGCEDGLRCGVEHVCNETCAEDEDCGADEYCDGRGRTCRATCEGETHQGCTEGEACVEGRCVLGCADDPAESLSDDRREEAPVIEWMMTNENGGMGTYRSTEWASRILCQGDEDWVAIPLENGDRLQVEVSARPSSGSLSVILYSPQGEVITETDPWAEERAIYYPPLGQSLSEAGIYTLQVKSDTPIEDQPYRLRLSASTLEDACFSDPQDPSDDTPRDAQSLGLTPTLRFTEEASGNLCFGDSDYYCFPMSISDGLDMVIDTPPTCSPLRAQLAPGSIFELGPDRFVGYTLTGVQGEGDWGHEGGARYSMMLDQESESFTNDEWCLRVNTEEGGACEGYTLSASFSRRLLVCSDLREPNNNIMQATEIDGVGPLADGSGEIPYEVDLRLPENLFLCPGDLDLFKVTSSAGDAWRAWLVDDSDPENDPLRGRGQLVGSLQLTFLNNEGSSIGDASTINPAEGEALNVATAISAVDQPLFLQVSGIEDSAGPYQLYLRRVASDGACSQDVNEPSGEGDDQLNPVSQLRTENEGRFTLNNGYLCDPEGQSDEDWYTFEIAQNNTRVCINSSFRHQNGDVNLELFPEGDLTMGELCQTHEECRERQAGSSCIGQRCRVPSARGNSLDDGEMIHFSAAEGTAGRYYTRVFSPDEAENAYQLSVTLVPPSDQCAPDYREGVSGNDTPANATQLGSAKTQICDAWVCDFERNEGDWYEVIVPAGAQRTLHLQFESQQGRLIFSAEDASSLNGQIVESPRSPSRNVHCINVIAGPRPATLKLQVTGDTFNVGQPRIDYLLHVIPVDLNQSPRGACDQLSDGLFNGVSWPTLDLRE